ncbi:alginate lyase family protein [Catenulispora yoronensis]
MPHTVLLDGPTIAAVRARISVGHGTAAQTAAVAALVRTAESDLTAGPWSVMDKAEIPPSGDRHDYMSQAPYWWPSQPMTPDNPLGCPYIQKDGQRYPGADAITDHTERGVAWNAIRDLTLAWYYTGRADFAQRAELDVRTWFTNPATAMNPTLAYAQGIPCQTPGRGTGIIESSDQIVDVLDAFALLDAGAPGWTHTDHAKLQSWMTQYLNWMLTSTNGKDEEASTNNHGSWLDQQDAAIALYVGQRSQAAAIAQSAKANRIAVQIQADGSQPLELSRTRSWHYSNFNVTALCRLAEVGRHVGVDLWSYTAPGGVVSAKRWTT